MVPLRSGDRDRGYLEVRDRLSRWGRFRDEDLQLLETLSGHVATALDNLRLLEIAAARGLPRRDHRAAQPARAERRGPGGDDRRAAAAPSCWSSWTCCRRSTTPSGTTAASGCCGWPASGWSAWSDRPGRSPASRPTGSPSWSTRMPEAELTALGTEILATVGRAYSLDGIEVDPQAVVGIAFVTGRDRRGRRRQQPGSEHPAAARRDGDAGGQGQGRSRCRSTGPSMGEVYRRRFQLVTQFRQAVEQGRIIVHYQPKVDLAERELVGVEALVRWMHPGVRAGLAGRVRRGDRGHRVDRHPARARAGHRAAAAAGSGRAQGIRITAAVNLSVRNLLAEDFPTMVAKALRRTRCRPSC